MCPRLEIFLSMQEVHQFDCRADLVVIYIYRVIKIRNFYKFHTILRCIIQNCPSKDNYTLEISEKFSFVVGLQPKSCLGRLVSTSIHNTQLHTHTRARAVRLLRMGVTNLEKYVKCFAVQLS